MNFRLFSALCSVTLLVCLAGCGGGGGTPAPSKVTTKLYLFGTMSSNSKILTISTTVSVPTFKDYTVPSPTAVPPYNLRTGLLRASGPVLANSVSGVYDTNTKKLTIKVINGSFLNLSSSVTGKGKEFASLTSAPGTVIPASDPAPVVTQQRLVKPADELNGCTVNYAP